MLAQRRPGSNPFAGKRGKSSRNRLKGCEARSNSPNRAVPRSKLVLAQEQEVQRAG
jgi:hypothetical protein